MTESTLTRIDISDALSKELDISRNESVDILEQVLEEISSAVLSGEDVKISLFGTFALLDKKERIGRNPKTGVEVKITPRRVITFRASQNLRAKVNIGCQKKNS